MKEVTSRHSSKLTFDNGIYTFTCDKYDFEKLMGSINTFVQMMNALGHHKFFDQHTDDGKLTIKWR